MNRLNNQMSEGFRLIDKGELLEKFLELDLFGIAIVDMTGRIITANETCCKILGYAKNELTNKKVIEVTYVEDIYKTQHMMEKVKAGAVNQARYRKRFKRKDGKPVWVTVNYSLIFDEGKSPAYYYAIVNDISSEKEIEDLVSYRLEGERLIAKISKKLLINKSANLDSILEWVGLYTQVDRVYIFHIEHEKNFMNNIVEWCRQGVNSQKHRLQNLSLDDFPWWMSKLENRERIKVEDIASLPDEAFNCKEILMEQDIKSVLVLPIYSREDVLLGFIGFDDTQDSRRWCEGDIHLLEVLSEMISVYCGYQKERKFLETTMNSLVHTLTLVSGIRDPYTTQHQQKVAEIAIRIAEEMNLSEIRINKLRIAAMLHDIGKMKVPAEILTKPGSLSKKEFELIKDHSQVGYEIMKEAGFDEDISQIVYQHHEKLDGSGYPLGLVGDEIVLEARILSVADVVEAMSSHRPYRSALGLNEAIKEIRSYAGVKYDNEVVQACINILEKTETFSPLQKQILNYLIDNKANYASPITSDELGKDLRVTPSYVRHQTQELIQKEYVEVRKGRGGGYYINNEDI